MDGKSLDVTSELIAQLKSILPEVFSEDKIDFQRLKNEQDPTKKELNMQPNIGVGLRLGRLVVDYALTNIGNVSAVQYSHIFSLKLDFKKKQ